MLDLRVKAARPRRTLRALEETRASSDEKFDVLAKRILEAEVRLATGVTGLSGKLDEVKTLLKDRLDLRDRVERCELDIVRLKERAGLA
jgi:hypothetical protein